jgi:hypothetical protein
MKTARVTALILFLGLMGCCQVEKTKVVGWLTDVEISKDGGTATFHLRHAYCSDQYEPDLRLENVIIKCPIVIQRHLVKMILSRDLSGKLVLERMIDTGEFSPGYGVFGPGI